MKCLFKLNLLLIFGLIISMNSIVANDVIPTNEWVNFYSDSTILDGQPIPVGSVIEAYDPDTVLCGRDTVDTEGQYGFLLVYKDDFTTDDIDEGADPGDTIAFYINGHLAIPQGPDAHVWTSNGDVIKLNLSVTSVNVEKNYKLPSNFFLSNNYPNPFNPTTTIDYTLPFDSNIRLIVFNIFGEKVGVLVNREQSAGFYNISWGAKNMPSGVYFYRIEMESVNGEGSFSNTKKMMLLK